MLFQMVPFILLCMVAHLTITWLVETIPTANQRALCWWFLKLPWREKRKVPSERAMKIESETGVKSDTPFCSRLPIKKTNSGVTIRYSCGGGRTIVPTQSNSYFASAPFYLIKSWWQKNVGRALIIKALTYNHDGQNSKDRSSHENSWDKHHKRALIFYI